VDDTAANKFAKGALLNFACGEQRFVAAPRPATCRCDFAATQFFLFLKSDRLPADTSYLREKKLVA
jgi:hypothetical protein